MTLSRDVQPNQVVFVTRRTQQQRFLFRPDPRMRNAFTYFLAHYARLYGIRVCAFLLMSDHYHVTLIDVLGQRPHFFRDFHRSLTLYAQRLHGWKGAIWDGEQTHAEVLENLDDELRTIAYIAVNPVAAGLVRHERKWPGARSNVRQIGREVLTTQRPALWIDTKNKDWCDEERLELVTPPCLRRLGDAAPEVMQRQLDHKREEARAKVLEERRGFMGAKACLAVSPYDQPASRKAPGRPPRDQPPKVTRRTGPFHSARRRQRRQRRRAWLEAYAAARLEWRRGNRDVVFPAGTWLMRILHAVRVHPLPS
jgi:REP element-mobilizing transposase RayT